MGEGTTYGGGGGSLLNVILALWAAWNMAAAKSIPHIFDEQVLQTIATIVVWYFIIVGWFISLLLIIAAVFLIAAVLWKLAEYTAKDA